MTDMQGLLSVPMGDEIEALGALDCAHLSTEVRQRGIRGGGVQFRHQCLSCGAATSNPLKQSTFAVPPPLWDESLADQWDLDRRIASAQAYEARLEKKRQEGRSRHEQYLRTERWQQLRARALQRDGYVCQGCLEKPAVDVRHLTYANHGDELLYQLVSLCKSCHERAHHRGSGQ
jgi:hypothetical protein